MKMSLTFLRHFVIYLSCDTSAHNIRYFLYYEASVFGYKAVNASLLDTYMWFFA